MREFWRRAFSELDLVVDDDRCAARAVLAHRTLYANHLGSSWLQSDGPEARWEFGGCQHGDEADVCEAHIGFLEAAFRRSAEGQAVVTRSWSPSSCVLRIVRGT